MESFLEMIFTRNILLFALVFVNKSTQSRYGQLISVNAPKNLREEHNLRDINNNVFYVYKLNNREDKINRKQKRGRCDIKFGSMFGSKLQKFLCEQNEYNIEANGHKSHEAVTHANDLDPYDDSSEETDFDSPFQYLRTGHQYKDNEAEPFLGVINGNQEVNFGNKQKSRSYQVNHEKKQKKVHKIYERNVNVADKSEKQNVQPNDSEVARIINDLISNNQYRVLHKIFGSKNAERIDNILGNIERSLDLKIGALRKDAPLVFRGTDKKKRFTIQRNSKTLEPKENKHKNEDLNELMQSSEKSSASQELTEINSKSETSVKSNESKKNPMKRIKRKKIFTMADQLWSPSFMTPIVENGTEWSIFYRKGTNGTSVTFTI